MSRRVEVQADGSTVLIEDGGGIFIRSLNPEFYIEVNSRKTWEKLRKNARNHDKVKEIIGDTPSGQERSIRRIS